MNLHSGVVFYVVLAILYASLLLAAFLLCG